MGEKGDVERCGRREIFALPEVANLVRAGGKSQVRGGEMKRLGRVLEIEDGDVVRRACGGLRNPDSGCAGVRHGAASARVLIDIENFWIGEKGERREVVL